MTFSTVPGGTIGLYVSWQSVQTGICGFPRCLGMSQKLQEFVTFCRDAVMISLVES